MSSIIVTGTTGPIISALDRIAAIGRNPRGVLEAVSWKVITSTRHRMEAGIDPRGVRWDSYAPLNPLYASEKKGEGILRGEQNHLYKSITSYVDGNRLIWGSNLSYSRIHQLGGVIRPKNARALVFWMGGQKFQRGSVTIPQRQYLGFTDEDRETLVGELEEYLARAMGH
ncbi:phage virion morphogenesis protein [Acetobacter sicerae]|uniref:Phage virion morphogenesis protein n=1 Tax=Acetobacter sicerae TaxID=85325 RepID=A0ABS8VX51_9PROT|nr:phage virion morphogenesis protein [Acetobacter sicerae]MCE0745547.1 phage virion morphogenesis protein [Acetobacter sicerae]